MVQNLTENFYDNSDNLCDYIKNRSNLTPILTDKFKSYKSDDNKIHNIKDIYRDPYLWISCYNAFNRVIGLMELIKRL